MKIEKIERYDGKDTKKRFKVRALIVAGMILIASLIGVDAYVKNKNEKDNEVLYNVVELNTAQGYYIIDYEGNRYRIPTAYHLEKKDGKVMVVGERVDKKDAVKVIGSDGTVTYSANHYPGYKLEGKYAYKSTPVSIEIEEFLEPEELTNGR